MWICLPIVCLHKGNTHRYMRIRLLVVKTTVWFGSRFRQFGLVVVVVCVPQSNSYVFDFPKKRSLHSRDCPRPSSSRH